MENRSSFSSMNKNVLLVLVIILTPILVLGSLAMAGAENFKVQKDKFVEEEKTTTHGEGESLPLAIVEQFRSPFLLQVPTFLGSSV